MARRFPTTLLAAVIVAGATLAGCGSDEVHDNGVAELSADEILEQVRTAARDAGSARVSGEFKDDEGMRIALDITYKGAEGAHGTLSAEGSTFELLRVADDVYMKADADTWSAIGGDPAAGELLENRYVLVPPGDDSLADLAAFLNWEEFIDNALEPHGAISKGDTRDDVNGSPAVGLVSKGADGGVLWVATVGTPYPLRTEPTEGAGEGAIDFLDWDKAIEITAPAEEDVIDLSEVVG
jgi:hypothetical protein